jgi:LmbE family N-acetylglucosaminyl deacetylase
MPCPFSSVVRPALLWVAALMPVALVASPAFSASDLLHELHAFAQTGRVLYVAAHPDDENTRLITYLARGRGYRTGYLSLTRGDGGQNLIGTELRDSLGLIRTQELLAARRVDGGVQFFTRANDFGFSKTADETLAVWDRNEVLSDMVRVIRTFRPDVLITRFTPEPGGTHGHHTASAQLTIEAFRLAADPGAFADALGHLPTWQPKRVFWNAWVGRGGVTADGMLALDVGGYDPLTGESFGEIAARSRTMHKSQGFGALGSRGSAMEHFLLLAGEPASNDIMDGVDTSWARWAGDTSIGELARTIAAKFNPRDPAASVRDLLEIHRRLDALPASPLLNEKREQLDRIIAGALGLYALTTISEAEVVPGEALALRHSALVRSDFPVTWRSVTMPTLTASQTPAAALPFNRPVTVEANVTLRSDTPLTHPYWLRHVGTTGLFAVDDPELIGRPENPPLLPVEYRFEIEGRTIVLRTEPVQIILDPVRGELRRPLRAIPPVSVSFVQDLELLAPGTRRQVHLDLIAARSGAAGVARIEAPTGWTVTPADQPFTLAQAGERLRLAFEIAAPKTPGTAVLNAHVEIAGRRYGHGRIETTYDHIPAQLQQPPARLKAISLELATAGRRIGYLPGAGDLVPDALARMGYDVAPLTIEDLEPARLRGLDAVVLGIRALNTRGGIETRVRALFDYAQAGGTVIMQYNTSNQLLTSTFTPYPMRLSRDRVTEENSPVTLLAPDHAALTRPNRITPADFEGWVQERGLYFPDHWDEHFTPLLSAADTGEPQRTGALLVARHGQGWFVYTGLSFFRQLPEGVPGAYRLFANLVSLGK